jgi:hypothetical protein
MLCATKAMLLRVKLLKPALAELLTAMQVCITAALQLTV